MSSLRSVEKSVQNRRSGDLHTLDWGNLLHSLVRSGLSGLLLPCNVGRAGVDVIW